VVQSRRVTTSRRLLVAGVAAALTAAMAVGSTASPVDHSPATQTPYPGGRWQPGPATYGITSQKNVHVRMSDGVQLVADVYYPASLTTGERVAQKFPVLLQQTPYTNTTGTEDTANGTIPGPFLITHGYIYVSADVRGTGRSGGNGSFFGKRDALDGVELVHWAAKLPGSNGIVGLAGCSYLAQAQLYTAAKLGRHSPVKAMLPECISGDVYRDTYFENGIPSLAWHGAGLASGTLLGPSIERYLATKYVESQRGGATAYDRYFWHIRDHLAQARAIVRTHIPALMWDGWDEPGFGGQELYAALQNAWAGRSPFARMRIGQRVTGRYQLIVGDWSHGGRLDPGIELEWFDTWLKHRDTGLQTRTHTPMHLAELPGDRWVNTATYPMTADYTRYFLGADGVLARTPQSKGSGSLTYAPPQPDDTLTFTTGRFAAGATVAGPIAASIYASSTTANLELMADVYDVAPDGTATQIAHGGILGSLRRRVKSRSWADADGRSIRPYLSLRADHPVPVGTMRRYDIPIQPAFWSLKPGHRLRIVLAAQPDPSVCITNGAKVVARVIGCLPRPAILATLAGGRYTIAWGGAERSAVNLPLLPYRVFATVRSGVTPTSGSTALPLDWASPR
jgi:predicted acyl esterase